MTKIKNQKRKEHIRIMLRDRFGFAEHQEKSTYGFGFKLPLTRNSDIFVSNKDNATNLEKNKVNLFERYVPHYTPSFPHQAIFSKQILSKVASDVQHRERSLFMKEVNTQLLWSFELGTQEGINVPIWIIIGFQQRDRRDPPNLNEHTCHRPPVTSAQLIIGTENYLDSGILLNYNNDEKKPGLSQIKETLEL